MSTTTHPRAYATVAGGAATFTRPDGRAEPIAIDESGDIRRAVIRRAAEEARRTGTPLELVTRGDRGNHRLLITADGTLSPLSDRDETGTDSHTPAHTAAIDRQPAMPPTTATELPAAEPERVSFIEPALSTPAAPGGWRGLLTSLGVAVRPSRRDIERAGWVDIASRQWAGCRTIAVVNGKGGVGKTMTCAMLAAVYGRHGGGNVLAWDNNDTRGTLGWRTEQGLYDTTVRDLIPAAPDLLSAGASVSDITRYVHHQAADRYDVLRSNPELLATDQRIGEAEFDLLTRVASRYYRLVIFDSGNDESAARWLRMIDCSYQLVVPTLAAAESAESAALLLDALRRRDERSALLARNAVVVVTEAEPADHRRVAGIVAGFEQHVRAVHTIPFDPALKSGPLHYGDLRPATCDAWLRVTASAATSL